MKKKATKILLALLTCAFTVGAFAMGFHKKEETIMRQLINQQNQFIVVEVEGEQIKFNDPVLEEQMKEIGIFIPPSQRQYFDDKKTITLDDPQFLEAFEKYYIPSNLHQGSYKWITVKTSA